MPNSAVCRLDALPPGRAAIVVSLDAQGIERRRLLDLGFTLGSVVLSLRRSPSGDPTAFRVRGSTIALRSDQSRLIAVRPL
ncbi:MAG: ferrous iron transport protein A [Firmicutes bacterium]|nr:ferrous iron transport protein A [Bacillota bacterium]